MTDTTFVYTDIEDSTGHWQRLPGTMLAAQEAHDGLVYTACHGNHGRIFRQIGDAFCMAFPQPLDAVKAALALQSGLQTVFLDSAKEVPLRARIAIHTGPAEPNGEDFYGLAPARVARVLESTQGGQVLLTEDTARQVTAQLPPHASLADLGPCRLRSFEQVEHLFQLHHPDLPLIVTPPRSAVAVPNNLPRQLTPFFGREAEIAEARRRLTTFNLLTLVGMGGCGKTRLSLRLTDFIYSDFADGIYFVDLSGQRDDSQVAQTVATTLGIKGDSTISTFTQVVQFLQDKTLLLLLDNCEQIIEGAAELAAAILQAAPGVRLIATSREPLGVLGEALIQVRPLPLPQTAEYPALLQGEAVRLFAERAASQSPRFQVTRENAAAVASVCRRVDGIPLGLVLSAAWAGEYSPEEIATQLEERFNLLMTGRIRTLPARHRTLYATVDWGYSLLTNDEQTLLRCLAVFRGGCTPEAAQAVCRERVTDVSKALETLVRKSLLTLDTETLPGATRYRLMEPVREYGEERLRDLGEWEPLVGKHCAYFVAWAEALAPQTIVADSRAALEEMDADQENLQAALQSADQADDASAGVRFLSSLYWYWHMRGAIGTGQHWVNRFLKSDVVLTDPLTHLKAVGGAGVLASDAGEHKAAKALYLQSVELSRALNDKTREANCLANVGRAARRLGELEEAEQYLDQALSITRALGGEFRISTLLSNLGSVVEERGDIEKALDYLNQALAIQRRFPPTPSLGITLSSLADMAKKQGDWGTAFEYLKECFYLRRELKNPLGVAFTLEYLPAVLLGLGRPSEASLIHGVAQSYRDFLGIRRDALHANQFETDGQKIRTVIGGTTFEQKEKEGRLLNLDDVAKLIFEGVQVNA